MRIEKIRLDEVKKTYGDIKALEDISLSLYQGELLCVAGGCQRTGRHGRHEQP